MFFFYLLKFFFKNYYKNNFILKKVLILLEFFLNVEIGEVGEVFLFNLYLVDLGLVVGVSLDFF